MLKSKVIYINNILQCSKFLALQYGGELYDIILCHCKPKLTFLSFIFINKFIKAKQVSVLLTTIS